jgi:hypothetical protein
MYVLKRHLSNGSLSRPERLGAMEELETSLGTRIKASREAPDIEYIIDKLLAWGRLEDRINHSHIILRLQF